MLVANSARALAVDQIRLSSDMKFEGRAAVLVITHESPAYSLTPQGQKEAEERAREFKLEREKQEAEKKEAEKKAEKEKRTLDDSPKETQQKSTILKNRTRGFGR